MLTILINKKNSQNSLYNKHISSLFSPTSGSSTIESAKISLHAQNESPLTRY